MFSVILFIFPNKFLFYQAKKGDSYSKIAKLYDLNYIELLNLNKRKKITPSTILKITPHYYYKIKKGDTLDEIAEEHQVPASVLKDINKLGSRGKIFYGNSLKIPFPDDIDFINELEKENSTDFINVHLLKNQKKKVIETFNDLNKKTERKIPLKINWPLPRRGSNISIRVINSEGLLLEASKPQNKVYAGQKGKVSYVGNIRGYGKSIFLKHSQNIFTVYLGLKNISLEENQSVSQDSSIGTMGKYLYFFVFQDGLPVDPNAIF